jgi:hypothetical protein
MMGMRSYNVLKAVKDRYLEDFNLKWFRIWMDGLHGCPVSDLCRHWSAGMGFGARLGTVVKLTTYVFDLSTPPLGAPWGRSGRQGRLGQRGPGPAL